jgi:transcription elongation factor Elf1
VYRSRPANERDRIAWHKAHLTPPDDPPMVKCPCCGGSTVVHVDYRDKTRIESCGICHGSGEVYEDEAKEWSDRNGGE